MGFVAYQKTGRRDAPDGKSARAVPSCVLALGRLDVSGEGFGFDFEKLATIKPARCDYSFNLTKAEKNTLFHPFT